MSTSKLPSWLLLVIPCCLPRCPLEATADPHQRDYRPYFAAPEAYRDDWIPSGAPRRLATGSSSPAAFDAGRALPPAPEDHACLERWWKRTARLRFTWRDREGRVSERTVGDVARGVHFGHVDWPEVGEQLPELGRELEAVLGPLLVDDRLESERWSGGAGSAADGFFEAASWTWPSDRRPIRAACDWDVYQHATLLFLEESAHGPLDGSLAVRAIKFPEKEFGTYPDFRGVEHPYADVHLSGRAPYYRHAPSGSPPHVSWLVSYRIDLPWIVGDMSFDMNVLESLDGAGFAVNEYYSYEAGVFHWMAGRDCYVPLYTADGGLVAVVLVTSYGCDLSQWEGAHDDEASRRQTIRENQGNLKLRAQAAYRRLQRADRSGRTLEALSPTGGRR